MGSRHSSTRPMVQEYPTPVFSIPELVQSIGRYLDGKDLVYYYWALNQSVPPDRIKTIIRRQNRELKTLRRLHQKYAHKIVEINLPLKPSKSRYPIVRVIEDNRNLIRSLRRVVLINGLPKIKVQWTGHKFIVNFDCESMFTVKDIYQLDRELTSILD